MNRRTGTTSFVVLAAALVVSGCFKLSRTSPPVERFVLGGAMLVPPSAAAREASADSGGAAGLSIGLRRIDLAPYLATLAIVVRRADNEIVTTGFHRWAEGPGTGVNRAVSGYLASSAGIRAVDVAPWPIRAEHDYLVQLHVTRLEGVVPGGAGTRTGEAHVLAQWEIIVPFDGAIVARGVTDHRATDWVVDDYGSLVTRLDLGLVKLSREIVECLQRLGPAVATPAAGAPAPRPTVECSAR